MAQLNDLVVGHRSLLTRLESSLGKQRFPTSNLFIGPSGVGKFKTALLVAQYLLCEKQSRCADCLSCKSLKNETNDALLVIKALEASIKIDQTRQIAEFLQLKSTKRCNVVIMDGVDLMTVQAANTLLKTLEEPNGKTYFILIGRRMDSVLSTIVSRSQVWRFGPLGNTELNSLGPFSDWAVRASQGSLELAQLMSSAESEELRGHAIGYLNELLTVPPKKGTIQFDEILEKEKLSLWVKIVLQFFHDALSSRYNSEKIINSDHQHLVSQLGSCSPQQIDAGFQMSLDLEADLDKPFDLSLQMANYHERLRQIFQGSLCG